ncbi:hypothetical protein D3P07_00430 [Paenibacillus sp. 1011MAR3C5]|uniref:hypothetical protein n=1 Tax=Paenibacillus sp. 1011MAR3C5 TaxID=1675787 RepID=UPI000E6C0CFF|nr:hypothetical protein [Paenibacillus sp. 1011MAR3C5]RJE90611.1 hypothetical protein D3P07_00430 [Paenibacillus sp. 1011MAR3C5]
MSSEPCPNSLYLTQKRIDLILDPGHPLCRDDVVWMLGYIKKKVADEDPSLMSLSQPRLMQNFLYFAEASMALIQRRHYCDQEADRLRLWLMQAAHGLIQDRES